MVLPSTMLHRTETTEADDALRCRLQLHSSHTIHANTLTGTLRPLLASLDPTMTYVKVMTPTQLAVDLPGAKMAVIEMLVRMNCSFNEARERRLVAGQADGYNSNSGSSDDGSSTGKRVQTPSLSVMLFLKETTKGQQGTVSAESALRYLQQGSPWKFHHKIELSNARDGQMRVIGRQEFYSLDNHGNTPKCISQPLWSVCPVHCGNEHLRFTIFTQHFGAMVDFYRLLVGHEAEYTRPNFCLFTVSTGEGGVQGPVDIQLAVKKSPQLEPVPSTTAFLTFRVPSVRHLEALVHTPNGTAGTLGRVGDRVWIIKDPDSNCVLVEQTSPDPIPQSLSDSASSRSYDVTPSRTRTMPSLTYSGWDSRPPPHPLPPRTTPIPRDSRAAMPLLTPPKEYVLGPWTTSGRSGRPPVPPRSSRFPLPPSPWTDLSSWDSGWHSGRSDPDDTAPDDDDGDVDDDNRSTTSAATTTTTTTTTTGVLLCECDVTKDGLCVFCTGTGREGEYTILCDVNEGGNDLTDDLEKPCLPPRRRILEEVNVKVREEHKVKVKRRPWEMDAVELSRREWDDLISLTELTSVN